MIVGIFLRNIKTYRRIQYIPLSTGEKFCGLVGANGVGKSSILEALDTVFNDREWNLNIVTKRSGTQATNPYIVPVFLLNKSFIRKSSRREFAEKISRLVWTTSSEKINPSSRQHFDSFEKHRNTLLGQFNQEEYLLLPIGLDNSKNISMGIFDLSLLVDHLSSESVQDDVEISLRQDSNISSKPLEETSQSLGDTSKELEELEELDDFIAEEVTKQEENLDALDNEEEEENIGNNNKKLIQKSLNELFSEIKVLIEYIYIPKEIDPELFTKLETKEIQVLMGETLREKLETIITKETIDAINDSLKDFIDDLSQDLVEYSYRTPTNRRQQNLKKASVHNLVIEAFFGIRKLHKSQGSDGWLPIGYLSSGEKHKAIIDVAHNLLHHHRDSGKNLIIAIDEPESSLHVSACFDQINRIFDISQKCMQILFATHWYGFFPAIDKGNINVITLLPDRHAFDLVSLGSYREEVKQLTRDSRGKLPHAVRLKSINDLVQSIIASAIGDEPYNWIICEGSSEKQYLEKYFEDIRVNNKLRIVPVGGAGEIKKIYGHLSASYEDFKSEVKGKIILISDTDSELVEYPTKKHSNLICKRIVNIKENNTCRTRLVDIQSNPKAPKTEIEDALNGKLFYETLKEFRQDYPELLDFIREDLSVQEIPSHFALDLRPSENSKLEEFFDKDNNKFEFAKKYSDMISDDYLTPEWIQELKDQILE